MSENDINDASKLVVGHVRVYDMGEAVTVALVKGSEVCVDGEESGLCVFLKSDVLKWPLKRKVPVLAFDLHPWVHRMYCDGVRWTIVTQFEGREQVPCQFAPPLEYFGTAYTRAELMQARKEAGK